MDRPDDLYQELMEGVRDVSNVRFPEPPKDRIEPAEKIAETAQGNRFAADRTAAILAAIASGSESCEEASGAIAEHLSEQPDLERMLQAQVASLNVMFEKFAGLAIANAGSANAEELKVLGDLALRCQQQQRQAIEAIARIRKPRVTTFVKNYVDKQLNQLVQQGRQPQLQEDTHAPMDAGSTAEAGGSDKEVAAVAAEHRPKNRRRKA